MAAKLCCSADTSSIRRRPGLRHSGAHGVLVDAVAGEALELVREQICARRRVTRRKRRWLAVDVDTDEAARWLVLDVDRPAEPRPKPSGKQVRLRRGPLHPDLLHLGDLGP